MSVSVGLDNSLHASVRNGDALPRKDGVTEWLCIDTGQHDGRFNMDYDLLLVEEFKRARTPILRFFRWKPYCISLGKNQEASDINAEVAERDGIDVVMRPTGGKAVLHAEELTYSVIMETAGSSVRESYNLISKALVDGLRTTGADLGLSQSSADFRRLFHDPSTIPCFSSSAVYEVEHHGRKLVGSAQHRFGDILLQHGSILIGDRHKQIVKYLNVSDELKEKTVLDLDTHTATLNEILEIEVCAEDVQAAVRFGFEKVFGAKFSGGTGELHKLQELARARPPVIS